MKAQIRLLGHRHNIITSKFCLLLVNYVVMLSLIFDCIVIKFFLVIFPDNFCPAPAPPPPPPPSNFVKIECHLHCWKNESIFNFRTKDQPTAKNKFRIKTSPNCEENSKNPILPGLFWSFSARGVFGTIPCYSFL